MDAQFQVPKIPLVSANSLATRTNSDASKKHVIKPVPLPLSKTTIVKSVRNKQTQSKGKSSAKTELKKLISNEDSHRISSLLPKEALPKLCASCSQILVQYLNPIEAYIKEIINQVDPSAVSNQNTPAEQHTLSTFEFTNDTQTKQPSVQKRQITSQEKQHPNQSAVWATSNESPVVAGSTVGDSRPFGHLGNGMSSANVKHDILNKAGNGEVTLRSQTQSQTQSHHDSVTNIEGQANDQQSTPSHGTMYPSMEEQKQQQVHLPSCTDSCKEVHNEIKGMNKAYNLPDNRQESSQAKGFTKMKGSEDGSANFNETTLGSNDVRQNISQAIGDTNNLAEQPVNEHLNRGSPHSGSPSGYSPLSKQQDGGEFEDTEKTPAGDDIVYDDTISDIDYNEMKEAEHSPYAYVTIAYDNLSALNAILLANSIQLYNNKVLSVIENDDSLNKKILRQYHIPTVILICDSINGTLRNLVYQVFDKIIESKYQDAVLLNDESLGIQQYKIHLWKELAFHYEKCIFLESFTMVVGQISDLFLDSRELSACVDCFFPDNFNCSLFVFEPNRDTYKALLSLGMQLKLNEESGNQFDEDTLDETSLLNQFFAPKWRKLSFIYNFVRNDLAYTQVPAYFKFGDNIRVVNFGDTVGQHMLYSARQSNQENSNSKFASPMQPWNFKFNLVQVQLEEEPFANAPVDNYCKFYLLCFVRRIWPLLAQTLTPYLLTRNDGRQEWTIFELLQILGRESGEGFAQNPVTMRRKKSWAIDPNFQFNVDAPVEEETEVVPAVVYPIDVPPSEAGSSSEVETLVDEEIPIPEEPVQLSEENKRQWEDGRVDWMGLHQSDRIINRLKNLIHQ